MEVCAFAISASRVARLPRPVGNQHARLAFRSEASASIQRCPPSARRSAAAGRRRGSAPRGINHHHAAGYRGQFSAAPDATDAAFAGSDSRFAILLYLTMPGRQSFQIRQVVAACAQHPGKAPPDPGERFREDPSAEVFLGFAALGDGLRGGGVGDRRTARRFV